jgi:hypothetical protein
MKLKEARALRDEIRDDLGCYCAVPFGYPPDGYFARIWTVIDSPDGALKERRFYSRDEWLAHKERRAELAAITLKSIQPPRSPIEYLIDKACGLIP